MAKLYFKIASDWEEVVRLRNEIAKLKQELKGMDSTQSPAAFKSLNTQLSASTQRMNELVTNAAKAGAVIEGDFRKKIFDASQTVNGFTEKIIAQKAVVKDIEADVRRLGEAYRISLKRNPLSSSSKLDEYSAVKKALNEEKAALFGLTQEQANARLSVKKLRDEYSLYKNDGKQIVETNQNIGLSLGKALGVIGGVAALKQLGSEIIRVRGEFQSMQTAIETMVGKDMAGQLIPQIKELAKISPLTMSDMVGAEKMMLGFNIQAEDTIKYLKAISDISMGESGKFNSLTLAFSQMSAAGKLMGQDLNQMINAGFNPLQIIAEKTGKSIATLKEEMSKGAVSAEMVQQAFIDATSAGGKFFGMSENASKTINGQISMMQDALDAAFNEIGTKSEGVIMSGIKATTSLIQNYETVGKVLVGLIATYGAYRTAVMLATVATSNHTIAEIALTNVKVLARKAQLALNAAMLTNPYVLLATAIVGLGAAMWTFYDSATEAEKAQKRFNDRQKEAAIQEEEHKQKIDSLIQSSRDIALSDLQRGQSLAELRKEYKKIFAQYDIESIKLADILDLKRKIAEEDAKRAGEKQEKELADVEAEIEYYENLLKSLSGQQGVDGYVKKLKELRETRDIMLQEKGKGISEQFISSLKDVDISDFDRYISELEKIIKGKGENGKVKLRLPIDAKGSLSDEAIYDVKDIKTLIDTTKAAKKTKEEAEKAEKKSSAEWLASYKKAYEDAEKAYKGFLISKEVMSDADRDKELKRLKGLRDTAKATYESKGGSTSSDTKQEKQAEKLRKQTDKYNILLSKQALEQQRSAEDLQMKVDEARIKAMDEGSEKTIAEMELNFEKEMQAIDRQKENTLRKKIEDARAVWEANPENKGKSFDATKIELSDDERKYFDELYKAAILNNEKSYSELTNQYLSYTDQRLSIEKKFNDDIAVLQEARKKAEEKGNTDKVLKIDRSIAQATKNKGEQLIGLDYEQLKKSPDYVRAFENLKQTSSETLNSLLSQLENAKQVAAKTLSPDQLREYTSTIQSIMDELDSRNPFQALSDKKKELAQAEEELANAQMALEKARETAEAVKGGVKIENGISSKYNSQTGKIETTKEYLTEAQAIEKVTNATARYKKAKDGVVQSNAKVQKAEKELTEVFNELFNQISNVGNSIGGVTGEIIGLIGEVGSVVTSVIIGLSNVSKEASAAIQAVEKASVILAVISAAFQVFNRLVSIFGKSSKRSEELIRQYEALAQALDNVTEKHRALMKELSGPDAIAEHDRAVEAVKKKEENTRKAGKEYITSWKTGRSSVGAKTFDKLKPYRGVLSSIGINLDSLGTNLTNLFSLPIETLEKLQETEAWGVLDDKTREYIQTITDTDDEIDNLGKELDETLSGITFDSLKDSFMSSLSDMDKSAKDFAEDFESYMRNAIIKSFVNSPEFQKDLTDWNNKLSEYSKDGLDEDEIKDLREGWDDMVNKGIEYRNSAFEAMGINSNSYQQEATKGTFQTMSQDKGDELSGRFTAFQGSNEEIKNQSIEQTSLLSSINEKMSLLTLTNEDLQRMSVDTPDIAGQARENMGSVYQPPVIINFPTDQIKSLASDVSSLKGVVDEIRTNQIDRFIGVVDVVDEVSKMSKNTPVMNRKLDDINDNIKKAL